MGERNDKIYEFGEFRLQTEDGVLRRGEERIAVTQKAVEMLTLLLDNPRRVITRDEIIEHLWPETYVDENNLAVTVSMLRKALGGKDLIETIPRKGYRFGGEVTVVSPGAVISEREYTRTTIERIEIDDGPGETRALPAGRTRKRETYLTAGAVAFVLIAGMVAWSYLRGRNDGAVDKGKARSVAVLPFRDLSADGKGAQFSIGLADSLITKLAGIRGLSVRPMSAVMPLADENLTARAAGEKLNVETVLEGTIQRDGENYRVSVQLVNTRDEQVLWANVLEEKSGNMFAFQKLLSSQVADALAFKLTNRERNNLTRQPTENAEAYREYLLGRFFWNKRTTDDLQTAKTHFEKAIALDPAYAEAHSGLGATYILLGDSSYAVLTPAESFPKAKEQAQKALALDDSIAEAYALLGLTSTGYEWDVTGGERSLRHAIELNPSYSSAYQWLGWNLILQKRFSESGDAFTRAAELDPTSLVIASDQGYPSFFSGDYETAAVKFRAAMRLDRNYPATRFNIWRVCLYGGKNEEASTELEAIAALLPNEEVPVFLMARGVTLARQGKMKDARDIYDKMKARQSSGEFITPNFTATLAAELGETDDVFADLETFLRDRNEYLPYLRMAPEFAKYTGDPRFADLMKRAGLE